jgi:hypothetical protein
LIPLSGGSSSSFDPLSGALRILPVVVDDGRLAALPAGCADEDAGEPVAIAVARPGDARSGEIGRQLAVKTEALAGFDVLEDDRDVAPEVLATGDDVGVTRIAELRRASRQATRTLRGRPTWCHREPRRGHLVDQHLLRLVELVDEGSGANAAKAPRQ